MLIYLKKFFFSKNVYLLLFSIWVIKQISYSFKTLPFYQNLSIFLIIFFLITFFLLILAIFNLINKIKFLQYFFVIFFSLVFTNLFFDLINDKKIINNKFLYNTFNKQKEIDNNFDLRTQREVVEDLKKANPNVYPATHPKHNISKITQTSSKIFPLSGISKSTIVFCNESGKYSIYESDRYGFNNPDINYDNFTKKKVMLIGDSFVHGACVDPKHTLSSQLNKKDFISFSISYGGNGPLLELASLIEYISLLKPKIIIWFYAENDLFDLITEKESDIFIKYLNTDGFNQDLVNRQDEIDKYWKNLLLTEYNVDDYIYYSKNKSFFQKISRKIERAILLKPTRDIIKKYYNDEFQKYAIVDENKNIELFKKIIVKAKQVSYENNARIYFVYLPFFNSIKGEKIESRNKILKLVKDIDIEIIDFQEYLENYNYNVDSLFPLGHNGHYNSDGYKLLADLIYETINKD